MSTSPSKNPFEVKVQAMEKGFNNFPMANVQLTFRKADLTPAQVVQRLQAMLEMIGAARDTGIQHQAAVKACEKAMPGFHAFYEEAVGVLKQHFGSDPKILAMFGLRTPKHHVEPERGSEAVSRERGRGDAVEVVEVEVEERVELPGREAVEVEVEARVEEAAPARARKPAKRGRGSRR